MLNLNYLSKIFFLIYTNLEAPLSIHLDSRWLITRTKLWFFFLKIETVRAWWQSVLHLPIQSSRGVLHAYEQKNQCVEGKINHCMSLALHQRCCFSSSSLPPMVVKLSAYSRWMMNPKVTSLVITLSTLLSRALSCSLVYWRTCNDGGHHPCVIYTWCMHHP